MELFRQAMWNPFYITIGRGTYSIDRICVFDENDMIRQRQGWFGSNNNLPKLEIGDTVLKKEFNRNLMKNQVVSNGKNYHNELTATLYIYAPNIGMDFADVQYKNEFGRMICKSLKSTTLPITAEEHRALKADEETMNAMEKIKEEFNRLAKGLEYALSTSNYDGESVNNKIRELGALNRKYGQYESKLDDVDITSIFTYDDDWKKPY